MTIHRYEKCIIRLLHNEIINRFEPHLCIDFTGIRCAPSLIVPTVHIYKSKWANGIQIIVRQAKAVQIVFKAFLLVIQISPPRDDAILRDGCLAGVLRRTVQFAYCK